MRQADSRSLADDAVPPIQWSGRAANSVAGRLLALQRGAGNSAVADLLGSPGRSPVVQRLVDRAIMTELAGVPSARAIENESTYIQILNGLDAHAEAKGLAGDGAFDPRPTLLNLIPLVDSWVKDHTKQSTRRTFIVGLRTDIEHELSGQPMPESDSSPSRVAHSRAAAIEAMAIPDFEVPGDAPINGWRFTVVAAIEHPDYVAMQTAKFKKRIVTPKSTRHKTGYKSTIAKTVLMDKLRKTRSRRQADEESQTQAFEAEVTRLAGAGCGHTYIKLSALSGVAIRKVFSFGFYPLNGVANPTASVPGFVRHPDRLHEAKAGESRRFKDKVITETQYTDSLARARQLTSSPPDYTMWDYNCTRFAKDIASVSGTDVPGDYETVPRGGKSLHSYSPNNTFDALDSDEDSYAESKDEALRTNLRDARLQEEREAQDPQRILDLEAFRSPEEDQEPIARLQFRADFHIVTAPTEDGWVEVADDSGTLDETFCFVRLVDLQRLGIPATVG